MGKPKSTATRKKTARSTASTRKASTKPKPKRETHSRNGATNGDSASTDEVTIDRRKGNDRRSGTDRRKVDQPVKVERRKLQRRAKVNRRRQIDPTTCERDYTPAEVEFMNALDQYKRASGRMFPTCSEVLEVIQKLGYRKVADEVVPEQSANGVEEAPSSSG